MDRRKITLGLLIFQFVFGGAALAIGISGCLMSNGLAAPIINSKFVQHHHWAINYIKFILSMPAILFGNPFLLLVELMIVGWKRSSLRQIVYKPSPSVQRDIAVTVFSYMSFWG